MNSGNFDLSIIIVNYNAGRYLERCLSSIEKFSGGLQCEIFVVDNASGDNSLEILGKFPGKVKVIKNSENLGFSKGINRGLSEIKGRYCFWLNPDAELTEGSLSELITYLDDHPEIGVLGPQILNPDGSIQLSCRSFPSYQTALFNRYSLLTRLFPGNPISRKYLQDGWKHDHIRETDWVSGAALIHRREIVRKVGELDEHFFMYCEDVDFCLRVRRAGSKVFYHPGLKISHHIGGSSRLKPFSMIIQRHRSMWFYYRKHYKRNILKDFTVGSVIAVRCLFLIQVELLCRYNRRERKIKE